MSIDTYAAIYAVVPFEILINYDFASDLSSWDDPSGSWSWVSGGGTEYDNDGEFNPLTQGLSISGTGWYYFEPQISSGATGTIAVEVRDSLGLPIYRSDTSGNYVSLPSGDYTIAVLADDFDGVLEAVHMRVAIYRPPQPDESDITLVDDEKISNPIFGADLSDWTDATSSWSWDVHSGAAYDNDGDGNYLTQDVVLDEGWHRLGIILSDGATADVMTVEVDTLPHSKVDWEAGERGRYFYVATPGVYTVKMQAENLTGYVTQVTLLPATERTSYYSIVKSDRTSSVQAFEIRAAYNHLTGEYSTLLGQRAGLHGFNVKGSTAVGDRALQEGSDYSVAVGSKTLVDNEGERNTAVGYEAGKEASGNGLVLLGHKAGRTETDDDKLHVANTDTESLIQGNFAEHTVAIGFDDLTEPTATVDLAASPDHRSLRVRGGVQMVTEVITGAYSLNRQQYVVLCDASGGAFTVLLPPASESEDVVYFIKKIDSSGNAVTVDGDDTETIDGATTKSLSAQYATLQVICDGSNWHVLSQI